MDSSQEIATTCEDNVTVELDLLSHVAKGISRLWQESLYTDINFLVGEEKMRVAAHRIILATQSDYFTALFFGNMAEGNKDEIEFPDILQPNAFLLLMEYAYTGQLEIKDGKLQDVLDVLAMADRFAFIQLEKALCDQLVAMVTLKNVLHLLLYADLYQTTSLLQKCLTTINMNAEKVLASKAFSSLSSSTLALIISQDTFFVPEMKIYDAVIRWKDCNPEVSPQKLKEVLDSVRLSEIAPKDLFVKVEPASLFNPSDISNAVRVQIKPEFEQMKPRGRKAPGKNVFEFGKFIGNSRNVTYTPQPQTGLPSMLSGTGLRPMLSGTGPPSISNGCVSLDAPRKSIVKELPPQLGKVTSQLPQVPTNAPLKFNQTTKLGGGSNRRVTQSLVGFSSSVHPGVSVNVEPISPTMTVELNDVYLINTISIKPFHESPITSDVASSLPFWTNTLANESCFSYKIRISKNNTTWETLFDFTEMDCYFDQVLEFPTQAARFIEFELTSCYQPLKLKLINCSFKDDKKQFDFRENGVIAPLCRWPLMGFQVAEVPPDTLHNAEVVTAVINTPITTSQLSFNIAGPKDYLNGDVAVHVSASWDFKQFKEVGSFSSKEFGTEVRVSFKESVVSYILVLIRNVQKKTISSPSLEIASPIPVQYRAPFPQYRAPFPQYRAPFPQYRAPFPQSGLSQTLARPSGQSKSSLYKIVNLVSSL